MRKRELISLSHDLIGAGEKDVPRLSRTAIVLAYAHWEGFIKDSACAYVYFVSHKSRKLSDLVVNFQALACRQELLKAQGATRQIEPHIKVAMRFVDEIDQSFQINANDAIDTESNLTSIVLKNICMCIGIDYRSAWSTEGPFIDDLVKNRCAIAHGEFFTPNIKYAIEVIEFTINAISRFSTDIENAAIQNAYLRNAS